jgi:hypothetical protein
MQVPPQFTWQEWKDQGDEEHHPAVQKGEAREGHQGVGGRHACM